MAIAIKVENLSKAYQLGEIGTGTISRDLERWFAKVRGKEDPFLKIGEVNDRATKGTSDIVWSLKDINFEIQQGDAVGIIGRNGAGKSTLLKILSRVTAPTSGKIKVRGRIASLLEVGTGFHPELTGRENIFLNGAILGMRKKEIARKFDEIVDFSGVERYIDTPVKRYSSGMYVRLAFAVAAHLESEILIVDEVLAVGDAEFQQKCLGKMNDVSKGEGRTVLLVSHNMGVIQTLCKNAVLLDAGILLICDQTQLVFSKYFKNLINQRNEWTYKVRSNSICLKEFKMYLSGIEADTLLAGATVFFKLVYTCLNPEFIGKRMSVSLLVFDESVGKLSNLWTDYELKSYEINEEIIVECKIEKWPFRKGNFRFDVYTHMQQEPLEWIENVYRCSSENGDYYGYGILTDPDQGNFFINHKFF